MSTIPAPVIDLLRERVVEGWSDDEILDDLDRAWNVFGRLWPWGPGGPLAGTFGPMPLRVRGLALAVLDETRGTKAAPAVVELWSKPKWVKIARAFQEEVAATEEPEPSQENVAKRMKVHEGTLRARLRGLGVPDWRDVPGLVAAEPAPGRR